VLHRVHQSLSRRDASEDPDARERARNSDVYGPLPLPTEFSRQVLEISACRSKSPVNFK